MKYLKFKNQNSLEGQNLKVTVNGLECKSYADNLWANRWHVITCPTAMYGKSIKIETDGSGPLQFSHIEVIHDQAAGTAESKALAT